MGKPSLARVDNPSRKNRQNPIRGGKSIDRTTAISMFYDKNKEISGLEPQRGELEVPNVQNL